jgi:beta-lactamase class A
MRSRAGARVRRLTAFALVALLPACATGQTAPGALAPVRADTAALHRSLDSLAAAHHGVVGYSILDLDSGARLSLRGDETFPTASLIKVAILVTLYDLIDKVPGSGEVQFLHDGAIITVHDAAWYMITISDNTATNLLLDRIIIRRVWEKMESLGLPHTKVHSKTFLRISSVAMDSSAKYGFGVSTPNEMVHLFELLSEGKAVSPKADSTMLDMLEHNEDNTLLQRYLDGVRAAHKTGAVDDARTECSLFYLRSRVIACVFTKENKDQRWILDSEPQLTMAKMGAMIARAWGVGDKESVTWPE